MEIVIEVIKLCAYVYCDYVCKRNLYSTAKVREYGLGLPTQLALWEIQVVFVILLPVTYYN